MRLPEYPTGRGAADATAVAGQVPVEPASDETGQGGEYTSHPWKGQPKREWVRPEWTELPHLNQLLLGGACLATIVLALRVTGGAVYAAIQPYTPSGKQATCLGNLQALSLALAAYSRDSDNLYPPMDGTTASGDRVTWVNRLTPYVKPGVLLCPSGASVGTGLSSYAMNPVLSGGSANSAEDAASTIWFADGGTKHDVSLLPPFPSWPSYTAGAGPVDYGQTNLDFRHMGTASVLWLDGHVTSAGTGDWLYSQQSWGGANVIDASLSRITNRSASSLDFVNALNDSEIRRAKGDLASNREQLTGTSKDVQALWTMCPGAKRPDNLDALGWRVAEVMESAGDESVQQALDAQTVQEANDELATDTAAKTAQYPNSQGFTITFPAGWNVEEKPVPNVDRTYFHSGDPNVYAVFETVFKPTATGNGPIHWEGMENSLQRELGYRYKFIGKSTLSWNEQTASTWEFEEDQPGKPKLTKLYIGYFSGFQSHIALFIAPAGAFAGWKAIFLEGLSGHQ